LLQFLHHTLALHLSNQLLLIILLWQVVARVVVKQDKEQGAVAAAQVDLEQARDLALVHLSQLQLVLVAQAILTQAQMALIPFFLQ
jgi:ABC-type Mn2+/Zn2+ transport system ATPase subunit